MERHGGETSTKDAIGVAKRDAGIEAKAMEAAGRVVAPAGGKRPAEKMAESA